MICNFVILVISDHLLRTRWDFGWGNCGQGMDSFLGDLRGFVMLILGFLWRSGVNGVIMGYNVCIIYIR